MRALVRGLGCAAVALSCASSGTSSGAASGGTASTTVTEHGELGVVDTRVGSGGSAMSHQCLYVHYVGILADGRTFETSRDTMPNGRVLPPIVFELGTGTVMVGWEKGLVGLRVGGARRLFVPYRMAYGAGGRAPSIPPRTDLVFDIDLLGMAAPLPASSNAPRSESARQCPAWSSVNRGR